MRHRRYINLTAMPLRFLALLLLAAFNLHAQSPIGIGIHYAMSDSTHTYIVREVIAGNAGADAGLRRGDQLLAINGVPLAGQQTDAITRLFRGEPEGAAYKLTIRRTILSGVRAGERDIDLQVTPRAVVTPQACLSGDCKNGTGVYLDQATGRRLEGLFADGKLQQGKVFFASGRLWKEGSYKDGRLDGPDCTEYHDTTGNPVFRKGRFENGYLREGSMYSADKRYAEEGAWDEQGEAARSTHKAAQRRISLRRRGAAWRPYRLRRKP